MARVEAERAARQKDEGKPSSVRAIEITDDEIWAYLRENRVGDAKLYCRLQRGKVVYLTTWEKWLIWQGDVRKSTAVIDAFISLLRNTVSNTDEFIMVGQEIENLKNYVLINHARYGEKVQVEYFVLPQCMDYRVPKLILQPFVENAFFHAFPEGRSGHIRIFVKEEGENLRFDITDDGAGMTTEQLTALTRGEHPKSEHFTGIGIGNVDERIKLIYGMDYGINILSEEEKGTTVILLLRKEPSGS